MASKVRIKVKLESTGGTGYFVTTTKNPRNTTKKLEMMKYDPKLRKKVLFKEKKINK